MIVKCIFSIVLWSTLILAALPFIRALPTEEDNGNRYCLQKVADLANHIKSLPNKHYLHTLDGQDVALANFYAQCQALHPWCCLYEKFYYWRNETKSVISDTPRGSIAHRIRLYYNGMSTYCSDRRDPEKTHGDVAEFYDAQGVFMGLAVYMGDGKYCPLPDSNYHRGPHSGGAAIPILSDMHAGLRSGDRMFLINRPDW